MPYIRADLRPGLDSGHARPSTPGELTYVVFKTLLDYPNMGFNDQVLRSAIGLAVTEYMEVQGEFNYTVLSSVVGALMCASLEWRRRRPEEHLFAESAIRQEIERFYRHTVASYEDDKIEQNGDVN